MSLDSNKYASDKPGAIHMSYLKNRIISITTAAIIIGALFTLGIAQEHGKAIKIAIVVLPLLWIAYHVGRIVLSHRKSKKLMDKAEQLSRTSISNEQDISKS